MARDADARAILAKESATEASMAASGFQAGPATRVVLRGVVYYAVLIAATTLLWRYLPRATGGLARVARRAVRRPTAAVSRHATHRARRDSPSRSPWRSRCSPRCCSRCRSPGSTWLTRAKRGYQQSVVQLLDRSCPAVVAGIVLLVKYSLALAFSLAGIVAAVRFRNTLDDSKDAVYVFLATAIGLAVGGQSSRGGGDLGRLQPTIVLVLWYTDFGSAPAELDGRIADQRLGARASSRAPGTFVARIDDEVFQNMTREQLEGVAERAWRARARAGRRRALRRRHKLRVRSSDSERCAAWWSRASPSTRSSGGRPASRPFDGVDVMEYTVQLRKKSSPEDLAALIRAAGSGDVLEVEVLS